MYVASIGVASVFTKVCATSTDATIPATRMGTGIPTLTVRAAATVTT